MREGRTPTKSKTLTERARSGLGKTAIWQDRGHIFPHIFLTNVPFHVGQRCCGMARPTSQPARGVFQGAALEEHPGCRSSFPYVCVYVCVWASLSLSLSLNVPF